MAPTTVPKTAYSMVAAPVAVSLASGDPAAALRERLASVFGLVAASVRVVYRASGRPFEAYHELDRESTDELCAALERQPELMALPVQISGEAVVHLPFFHYLSSLVSLANLAAAFAFTVLALWQATPQPPPPFIYLIALPPLLLVYNAHAVSSAMAEEYLMNAKLRAALSRRDGTMVCLMLLALTGPDTFVLFCRTAMPTLGASLSLSAEQTLLNWAVGLHAVQDVPFLAFNVLMRKRLGLEWDAISWAMLGCSVTSLSFNLAWHVFRLARIVPEDDLADLAPSLASSPGLTPSFRAKTSRRPSAETAKYVGMSNQNIIGLRDDSNAYMA